MKKILSLLLAMIMVFSLATVAFAAETFDGEDEKVQNPTGKDENNNDTYTDIAKIEISKKYQLISATGNSPAEVFVFTATNGWDADADGEGVAIYVENPGVGVNNDANIPPLEVESNPSFAEGDATADGTTKVIEISLPEYTNVGVYHYTLTETDAGVAGVTYNDDRLHIVVTVVQQGNDQVRVAAVHVENGTTKDDVIVNTYAAGDLNVTKTVTGNLGDRDKAFHFTVTFDAPVIEGETKTVESAIVYTLAGTVMSAPEFVNNQCVVEFDLKHGQTASFENLPVGVTYTVEEDNYTADGYTTTSENEEGAIVSGDTDVEFTNNKTTNVDTGIALDSAPYFLMLAVALFGMVALVSKKRYEV